MEQLDYNKINNIVFEDIDSNDYPDFADAYIISADYDGREMTDEEIESLDSSFVNEKLIEYLF